MKFTFLITTKNRLFYLKNLVRSIEEFVGLDQITLIVVDNNSTEKGYPEYLASLKPRCIVKRFLKSSSNELQRAMNYGITYSRKRKIPYIHFLQDDYQFLYKDPDYLNSIEEAFANKNSSSIYQIQTSFIFRKIKKKLKFTKTTIKTSTGVWFRKINKPPYDCGITRTKLYNIVGKYPSLKTHGPSSGENWLAKLCVNRYFRALSLKPNLIQISANNKSRKITIPPTDYLVKPLDEIQIQTIKERCKKDTLSYGDDFIVPNHPQLPRWW